MTRLVNPNQEEVLNVFHHAPVGILILAPDTRVIEVNQRMLNILSCSEDDVHTMKWEEQTHPDDLINELGYYKQLLSNEISEYRIKKRFFRQDGECVWTNTKVVRVDQEHNQGMKVIWFVEDISTNVINEIALEQTEQKLSCILSGIDGIMYRCCNDAEWTMTDISEGSYNIIGYKQEELVGDNRIPYSSIIHSDHRERVTAKWAEAIKKKAGFSHEYKIMTASGKNIWVADRVKPMFNKITGELQCVVGILIDISKQKEKEHEIRYLAEHDTLTGAYNRSVFETLKNDLTRKKNYPLSVLVADIDGLKLVNDTFGHHVGDKLIKRAAKLLSKHSSKQGRLFRIGGDEFCVLLPRTSSEKVERIMIEIMNECDCENKNKNEEFAYLEISLGHGTVEKDTDSIDNVLLYAEDYMYRRKLLKNKSAHSKVVNQVTTMLHERSKETEEHAHRLIRFTKAIGKHLKLSSSDLDALELFSALHDIGKVGIPDNILLKKGKLTDEEWVIIKRHTSIGYRIACASQEFRHIADNILYHHERWDGNGYPHGLKQEEIPLLSRILAVVDTFDAITENRVYSKAKSEETGIEEIIRNSGTQFDPTIVSAFVEVMKDSCSC